MAKTTETVQDPLGPEIIPHDLPNDRVIIISGAWSGQFGTVNGIIKANGAYRIAVDDDIQTAFDRNEFVVLKRRQFPERTGRGMKVSLEGIITRLPDAPPGIRKGYNGMLAEFLKNIQEMAQRYYDGDTKVVDEFLQLYCLDEERKK